MNINLNPLNEDDSLQSESGSFDSSISIQAINENTSAIEEIDCDYRKIKSEIFGSLMKFKSYSRQIINTEATESEEIKEAKSCTENIYSKKKFELFKNFNDITNLYKELHSVTCELLQTKSDIISSNNEFIELHEKIRNLETTIALELSKKNNKGKCNCIII